MTRKPVAKSLNPAEPEKEAGEKRGPVAFTPDLAEQPSAAPGPVDNIVAEEVSTNALRPKGSFWGRLFWGALGLLVSLGLGLMAERLIRDLFSRYEALGWIGLGLLAVVLLAGLVFVGREIVAIFRLRHLAKLQADSRKAHEADDIEGAKAVTGDLTDLYAGRPDLARARETFLGDKPGVFDGAALIGLAERDLLTPIDHRARARIASSARRIALVTAVSPRALVDIAFVIYESARLARHIATLYGGRPGFFGSLRLARAVLGHLVITGGLALGEGVIEELLGQGLTARLSARLGEGLINGMMTVRVGIAAMQVTRPIPFTTTQPPNVREFMAELAKVTKKAEPQSRAS
ncbi:YcjF family protein [Cucumibacter marinus]|uniref:YcjF family protein n=1 Tax=Cucumibacter marinus TaxID=1121252 RepID=UPI0004124BAD|nr:TIGR01620 family protein [Cucumibacter marinus]